MKGARLVRMVMISFLYIIGIIGHFKFTQQRKQISKFKVSINFVPLTSSLTYS